MGYYYDDDTLQHHGIKGQKWGVRRFQNTDGSLTSKGKSRYGDTSDLYKAKKSARSEAIQSRRERMKARMEFGRALHDEPSKLKETRDFQNKMLVKKSDDWDKSIAKSKEKQQAYKDAKKAYNDEYKKNLEETRSKATLKDKLLYNDATRNRAAKLMTKYKDMSYEKATKTAQKEANRNTAIVLGAYGAVAVGALVAAQKTKEKGKHAYFVKTLEF